MRPLPPAGTTATTRLVVTDEMAATFDDEDVHPVYGTASLVRHFEQVARRLLKPLLEPGEEGVGARIEVRHVAPAPVGATIELTATVTGGSERRLVTDLEATCDGRTVATGVFEQGVVDLARWRRSAGLPDP